MPREDELFTGLTLEYAGLPLHTKYRFAELEISKAIMIIADFLPNKMNVSANASQLIYRTIQTDNYLPEHENEWTEETATHNFRLPSKEEQVIYFRYRNISYKNIREVTRLSPNTIAKARYMSVNHFPKFRRWDENMLHTWNNIKGGLNLYGQNLYHTTI